MEGRHGGIARPSNVIEVKTESSQGSHSAPFPRALVEFFVKAFSDAGDLIFDPFLGSGTTIAAAHLLDRVGYGVEISAGILRRNPESRRASTGDEPALASRRKFSDIRPRRSRRGRQILLTQTNSQGERSLLMPEVATPNQGEREFETGTDESFKNANASGSATHNENSAGDVANIKRTYDVYQDLDVRLHGSLSSSRPG